MEVTQAQDKSINTGLSTIMSKVFGWMFVGLTFTAVVAYLVANTESLRNIVLFNPFVLFSLIIIELILVFVLASQITKLQSSTALGLFFLYSVLNGATLSSIFIYYSIGSIAVTFLVASLMFGLMALYGYTTKKDLTGWGNLLFMGLIGLIIAMLVNLFIQSTTFDLIISGIGVLIFVGLTAFNVQKIKQFSTMAKTEEDQKKVSVMGALSLYLDFINIFLYLLRFFGRSR